jgi:hypothetical protein
MPGLNLKETSMVGITRDPFGWMKGNWMLFVLMGTFIVLLLMARTIMGSDADAAPSESGTAPASPEASTP